MTTQTQSHGRLSSAAGSMSPVLSALFLIVLTLTLVRSAVGANLLGLVMNYAADEGSLVEKIHPANYGFAAVLAFAVVAFRIELSRWETRVARAMLLLCGYIVLLIVYTVAAQIGSSPGFLVDNYMGACFAALLFLFPPPQRQFIGRALMVLFVLSALIAVVEFLFKMSVLPHPADEGVFRPVGVASHPLELGLWCAVGIPFATAAGWPRRHTILICIALFAGLAVSGARTAMLAGGGCALIVAIAAVPAQRWSRRRLERRLAVVVCALLVAPLLIGVLAAAGALDRFENGIADDSAATRVLAYQVFDYMSWSDIMSGVGVQTIKAIAFDKLHLFAIESAPVIFVAFFGLPGSLLFAAVFLWMVSVLLQGAKPAVILGSVLYIGVALSNNALSSKEPSIFSLTTLIIAFRPPERHGVPSDQSRFRTA